MTLRCLPVHDMPNPERDGSRPAVKIIHGRGEIIPLEIAPQGAPRQGETDRVPIIKMLDGYSATVCCRIKIRKGEEVLEPVRRGERSLQRFHAGMVRERGSDANTKELATILGVTPRTIENYRTKLSPKGSRGTSTDSAPAIELDLEIRPDRRCYVVAKIPEGAKVPREHMDTIKPILAKLNEIHADTVATRASAEETLAILREKFPEHTFAATVDRFVDDATAD